MGRDDAALHRGRRLRILPCCHGLRPRPPRSGDQCLRLARRAANPYRRVGDRSHAWPAPVFENDQGQGPSLHRWIGRFYVAACFAGGAAGGAIAMYSSSGPIAGAGFLSLAILWLLFTGLALNAALHRNFWAHERWMVRSFALTFAAVTLRIYLPIGIILNEGEFVLPYTIIAWLSWVPNLMLAEAWLATGRISKRTIRSGYRKCPRAGIGSFLARDVRLCEKSHHALRLLLPLNRRTVPHFRLD